jgi:hypothetical protein
MSKDVDEDLIEATIRRVAASKAAGARVVAEDEHSAGPDLHLVPAAAEDVQAERPSERPAVDESLIEATIRRVAESKAAGARVVAEEEHHEAPDLHVVPAPVEDASADAAKERPAVDESLIEATLRRIETEQAARAAQEVQPERELAPKASTMSPPQHAAIAGSDASREAIASESRWADAASELRRDIDETKRRVRALEDRLEMMFPRGAEAPLHIVRPDADATTPAPAPPAAEAADDDWDDRPRLPRVPLGMPPRPAIVRDPSPRAAVAAELQYDEPEVDVAPALKSFAAPPEAVQAPAPAEAKRGFDLLPRTYRITVEDKRRGVDLVPLHRALLGMEGVRDMSLLSYSNGTAIVALETISALDPDVLGQAVSHAMARQVKVEVHNEQTMVIKLAED